MTKIPEEQQKTIDAYQSNDWKLERFLEFGDAVMEIVDVDPETEKETPLTAYIDINGSSRIV